MGDVTIPLVYRRPPNPFLERQGKVLRPESATTPRSSVPASASASATDATSSSTKTEARPVSARATLPPPSIKPIIQSSPAKHPAYVINDREVLRYYAYLIENIFEGGDGKKGSQRLRKFSVCYYTASSTFSMEEPKEANSGLNQGTFMRKQQVSKRKKKGGGLYGPSDFEIGGTVEFYGRELTIVDADAYTRDYHKRILKKELGPAKDYPDDGYKAKRSVFERPTRQQAEGGPKKPIPFPLRDTKVLRFHCAYEDERKTGGRKQYTLYYYLEDDTAEIKELPELGTVRTFPNLLKRQKIPKGSCIVPTGSEDPHIDISLPYYSYEDFLCGSSITVYGRHLLIMSCDESTQAWYEAKGVHQVPLNISMKDSTDPVKIQVAPRNGFGTDDDLYALGLKLEPCKYEDKHARFEKSQRESKVLRFIVHLLRNGEEDKTRELILNYFMFDDTISIYEPPVRNSGNGGGLFLTRARYKKYIEKAGPEKENGLGGSLSRFLRSSDFLLTAPPVTFEVSSTGARLFTIKTVGYDDYTKKILEESGGLGDTARVTLEKQAESFVSAGLPVRAVLRAMDEERTQTVSRVHFMAVVRELEALAKAPPASVEEMEAVCKKFADVKGNVVYDSYVDALAICAPKSVADQAKEAVGAATLTLEERIFGNLVAEFLHGNKEGGQGALRATFRKLDEKKTGQADMGQWVKVLKEHRLTNLMSKTSASTMLLQYDVMGKGKLSYETLCDAIFVGNFQCPSISTPRITTTTTSPSSSSSSSPSPAASLASLPPAPAQQQVQVLQSPAPPKQQRSTNNLPTSTSAAPPATVTTNNIIYQSPAPPKQPSINHPPTSTTTIPISAILNNNKTINNNNLPTSTSAAPPATATTTNNINQPTIPTITSITTPAINNTNLPPAIFINNKTKNLSTLPTSSPPAPSTSTNNTLSTLTTSSPAQQGGLSPPPQKQQPSTTINPSTLSTSSPPATTTITTNILSTISTTSSPASTIKKLKAPTVKKYLSDLTNNIITCEGNLDKQLASAMKSFSSCFSRLQRKRILRKIWTAFDADRSGRITQAHFYQALKEAAGEFRLEFPEWDKEVLGKYLFPDAERSRVDFDKLLDAFCTRDTEKCKILRQQSLAGADNDEALFASENDSRVRDFGGTLRVVGFNT